MGVSLTTCCKLYRPRDCKSYSVLLGFLIGGFFALYDVVWQQFLFIWVTVFLTLALLLWDVMIEGVSWYVALSDKFVPQSQVDSDLNSEKTLSAFGENRKVALADINDPGSVDQVIANTQYSSVYSEEVEAETAKPKNIWKREVSYLHPLLADEGEEDLDEEQMADTTKVATYEKQYSQLFAALLFPVALATFSIHFPMIIGFPLAIRSFKRYLLAFDGYAVAYKEQRKLKSLPFLPFLGTLFDAILDLVDRIDILFVARALPRCQHRIVPGFGLHYRVKGKHRQDSSSLEFFSCWIPLFFELSCLDLRSSFAGIAFDEQSKGSAISFPSERVCRVFCDSWSCASAGVDHCWVS